MSNKLKNILSQTDCPETKVFYSYLDNSLSKTETHTFESHLNDCEFCQVALEGFSITDEAVIISSVDEINSKIDKRVKRRYSIQYLTAAASIMIGLFFGSIYFLNDAVKSDEMSVVTESSGEK